MRPCAVWFAALATAVSAAGTNLVDTLASMPEHTTFVHLLQRTRLIPTINELEETANITIFAPTNAAFKAEPELLDMWSDAPDSQIVFGGTSAPDNIGTAARQRLLYHMLNYTLPQLSQLDMHETLYRPARHGLNSPPSEDSGMLLGGTGQVIRTTRRRNTFLREEIRVGVDARGRGGAAVVATRSAPGGTIHSIDRYLDIPPTLSELVRMSGGAPVFAELTSDGAKALESTPRLTVFLPRDGALRELSELEYAYITGPYPEAAEDRVKLLAWHASATGVDGEVGYADRLLNMAYPLTTILGGKVNITHRGSRISFGDSHVVKRDVLMQNGVLHTVDKLHLPFGDLGLSLAKQLTALNATSFVRLMRKAGLGYYIDRDPHGGGGPVTLVVPPNEQLDEWDSGSDPLRDMLLYHIITGSYAPEMLQNDELVTAELVPPKLEGAQKVSVSVSESPGHKRIAFGNACVNRAVIRAGSSLIYTVDSVMNPPSGLVRTMAASGILSTFTSALFNTGLDRELENRRGTLLVPDDYAFKRLGVVARYLSLPHPRSRADMSAILHLHTLPLIYANDVAPEWTPVKTRNGDIELKRAPLSKLSARIGTVTTEAVRENVLTDSGVIHAVDHVLFPPDLDISIEKLFMGAGATIMPSLIREAGFGFIFEQIAHGGPRYMLLLPTDNAITHVNVTKLRSNPAALRALVALHILPLDVTFNSAQFELRDGGTYQSLLGDEYGTLALRRMYGDKYIIGIRGSRGLANEHHFAEIIDFGWTNSKREAKSAGILMLDSVLFPYSPRWYHGCACLLTDRWIIAACTGILAVVAFGVCCVWFSRRRACQRLQTSFEGEEE